MSAYPTAFTLGLQLQWSKKNVDELNRAHAAQETGLTLGLMVQSKPDYSDRREMVIRLDRTLTAAQQDESARQDLRDLNDKLGLELNLSALEDEKYRLSFLDVARRVAMEISRNDELDKALDANLPKAERESTVMGYLHIQRMELAFFRDQITTSIEGSKQLPEGKLLSGGGIENK